MKFQTAVNKLKKMATGKHCSIQYGQMFHTTGSITQECGVYIDGGEWYSAPTWARAFHLLENGPDEIPDDEAPEGEEE